jgi:hypothetical protein
METHTNGVAQNPVQHEQGSAQTDKEQIECLFPTIPDPVSIGESLYGGGRV